MEIRLARHGRHVAIITIDNQRRLNAMTRQMLGELGHLWDELERDECRCIVLTGAGERAFQLDHQCHRGDERDERSAPRNAA
jgi:enoyl-CoA hydratase/carnithine racemase